MNRQNDRPREPERGSDGASTRTHALALLQSHRLERLEEMLVLTHDPRYRSVLEEAVRIGRHARGGSHESGGAIVRDPPANARGTSPDGEPGTPAPPRPSRRIILDQRLQVEQPPIPFHPPEPREQKGRKRRLLGRD